MDSLPCLSISCSLFVFCLLCLGHRHTTRRPAPVLRWTGEGVLTLPLAHSGPGDEPRARRVGPRLLDLVIGQVLGHHATGACTERYLSKTASTIEPRPFFFRKRNPQTGNCHLESTKVKTRELGERQVGSNCECWQASRLNEVGERCSSRTAVLIRLVVSLPLTVFFFHIWRLDFWVVFFLWLSLAHAPYNFLFGDMLWWLDPWFFVFFFFVFGVFSRYPEVGFLSFSSQVVFNECTPMIFGSGTFCDESTLEFLWFLLVFGVCSRYPAFGLLSFASQFVFNECTPYGFLLGDILWWIGPWVFVVSSCVRVFFCDIRRLDFWVFLRNLFWMSASYGFLFADILWWIDPWVFVFFFFVFGVFSRYPAVGFLSFSSQVVFNECTPYDFLLGNILWWIGPWVFVVSSCVRGLFAISGVWIFECFFAICLEWARPMVFCLGTFCDESTLGFLCFFFCVRGLFAISGGWIFEFFFTSCF